MSRGSHPREQDPPKPFLFTYLRLNTGTRPALANDTDPSPPRGSSTISAKTVPFDFERPGKLEGDRQTCPTSASSSGRVIPSREGERLDVIGRISMPIVISPSTIEDQMTNQLSNPTAPCHLENCRMTVFLDDAALPLAPARWSDILDSEPLSSTQYQPGTYSADYPLARGTVKVVATPGRIDVLVVRPDGQRNGHGAPRLGVLNFADGVAFATDLFSTVAQHLGPAKRFAIGAVGMYPTASISAGNALALSLAPKLEIDPAMVSELRFRLNNPITVRCKGFDERVNRLCEWEVSEWAYALVALPMSPAFPGIAPFIQHTQKEGAGCQVTTDINTLATRSESLPSTLLPDLAVSFLDVARVLILEGMT